MTKQTTKTIAGTKITLTKNERYIASRPMARTGRTEYPVTIERFVNLDNPKTEMVLDGLSYEEANAFLKAFNNSGCSLNGRDW